MKYLKKFNESTESFKNTDDAIREFFIDYIDEDKDNLEIINGWVKDNRFRKEAEYIKKNEIGKYKRAKVIKLVVAKLNGVATDDGDNCLTSMGPLKKAISDIERFYALSEEEINFSICHDYDELIVQFIIKGEQAKDEEAKSDIIDSLLLELKGILNKRGYKRITYKGNFLDVRTPIKNKDQHIWLSSFLRRIGNEHQEPTNESDLLIFNWARKVYNAGFNYDVGGGDNQVVVKLKKV